MSKNSEFKSIVLIIHHNSPAQFRYLIPWLNNKKARIIFLSEHISMKLENCEHIQVKKPEVKKQGVLIDDYNTALAFQNELNNLKSRGIYPDIIIAHTGWGVGLLRNNL